MVLILLKPKYDGPFLSAKVNVDAFFINYYGTAIETMLGD